MFKNSRRISRYWSVVFTAALAIVLPLTGVATASERYQVDPAHSTAVFRVKHLSASYYNGRFNDVTGAIVFDPANPSRSSVELKIKAESVFTYNEDRDDHIKGPDFLNSKQFPAITFESSSIKKLSDTEYEVIGDLTIRGVSKSITTRVEHVGSSNLGNFGPRIGFSTSLSINRRDFGVNYGTDEVVGDKVDLRIDIEGIKQ